MAQQRQFLAATDRDSVGRTPLHYAVAADNLPAQEALLASGADPEARDEFGARPRDYKALLLTLQNGQVDRAAQLLARLSGVAITASSRMRFADAEFRHLCSALRQNRTVRRVVLDCNVAVRRCMEDLLTLFAENRTLVGLQLGFRECSVIPLVVREYLAANKRQDDLGGACYQEPPPEADQDVALG